LHCGDHNPTAARQAENPIRKKGWPAAIKTFRPKSEAQDWAWRTENEMVRSVYICIHRAPSERLTLRDTLIRYRAEVNTHQASQYPAAQKALRHHAAKKASDYVSWLPSLWGPGSQTGIRRAVSAAGPPRATRSGRLL